MLIRNTSPSNPSKLLTAVIVFQVSLLIALLLLLAVRAGAEPQWPAKPDFEDIIFATRYPGSDGHWYANFGHTARNPNQMLYGPDGGRLCRMNIRTSEVTAILEDPKGSVRDPHMHYDGKKILFSYRKGGSKYYHLYEINIDGTGLKQITDGPFNDIEPIYLPDDDVIFSSSRCNRFVPCWFTMVGTLYRCSPDGKNIHPISCNVEHENTPWMLPDGRVLYMRWEYVDRSRSSFHHLWTINPDGTGQMVFFGNMHPGTAMLDAKPIPGTGKVLSIFSSGHGKKEHAGKVTIVDPDAGPDERSFSKYVGGNRSSTNDWNCRDPYPLSEDLFLVVKTNQLFLMDGEGTTRLIYSLSEKSETGDAMWIHEPRPLRSRPREHIIPPRVDYEKATGRLCLADVTHGRNMGGVKPGEIKKLLVMEVLPKPVNHSGWTEPISFGGTFFLERILGTVPVEPDGSAYFEVPALRPVFFVALDKNDMSVKRMQSFVSVMPGETTGCVGCHEQRIDTPRFKPNLMALLKRRKTAISRWFG